MTSGPGYYPTSIVTNEHQLHHNTLYAFEPHIREWPMEGWGPQGCRARSRPDHRLYTRRIPLPRTRSRRPNGTSSDESDPQSSALACWFYVAACAGSE